MAAQAPETVKIPKTTPDFVSIQLLYEYLKEAETELAKNLVQFFAGKLDFDTWANRLEMELMFEVVEVERKRDQITSSDWIATLISLCESRLISLLTFTKFCIYEVNEINHDNENQGSDERENKTQQILQQVLEYLKKLPALPDLSRAQDVRDSNLDAIFFNKNLKSDNCLYETLCFWLDLSTKLQEGKTSPSKYQTAKLFIQMINANPDNFSTVMTDESYVSTQKYLGLLAKLLSHEKTIPKIKVDDPIIAEMLIEKMEKLQSENDTRSKRKHRDEVKANLALDIATDESVGWRLREQMRWMTPAAVTKDLTNTSNEFEPEIFVAWFRNCQASRLPVIQNFEKIKRAYDQQSKKSEFKLNNLEIILFSPETETKNKDQVTELLKGAKLEMLLDVYKLLRANGHRKYNDKIIDTLKFCIFEKIVAHIEKKSLFGKKPPKKDFYRKLVETIPENIAGEVAELLRNQRDLVIDKNVDVICGILTSDLNIIATHRYDNGDELPFAM